MTAPSYTEDLTDLNLADSTTGWAESTVTSWKDGGAATTDTDYPYIQGTVAITQQATKSTYASLLYNNGSGITIPTDGAILVWQVFSSPTAIQNQAGGGMMGLVGSSLANFKVYYWGGSDYGRNPYGGWANFAVNPSQSADTTVGTVGTPTNQYVGAAVNLTTGIGKGNPHGVDAIRYGRGSSIYEYGDSTSGYCTFSGFATKNDYNDATNGYHRWGLMQNIDGGYLYKGKMTLGTATNAVDFRDSDANILIDDTPYVTTNFNTIEINNASSRVDWTNVKFTALGTQSAGRLVTNANADLNWDACQFTDMTGTFEFGGTLSTCTNAIWSGCGQVNSTGVRGDFSGSQILVSAVAADEGAFYWNVSTNPQTYTDGCTFTKGTNAHHAIRFGTAVTGDITLENCTLDDFNSTDSVNDSTFRFDATTGSLTLSLNGCSVDGASATEGAIGVDSAGITVTLSIDPVTTTLNIKDEDGNNESGVQVWLAASSAAGDLPFEQSITSISQAAGSPWTRTVTFAAAHGLKTNDYLKLYGITNATEDNNGAFQVTYSSDTVVTYTGADTGETSFTGTITGTGGILYGTTDASGNISKSRTWAANQPYTGQARKSSSSPRYKTIELDGTISSSANTDINRRLVLDE